MYSCFTKFPGFPIRMFFDLCIFRQTAADLREFITEVCDERETIEDGAGHISLLPAFSLLFCIPPTIGGTAFRPASV
jgi:hypothetical protein